MRDLRSLFLPCFGVLVPAQASAEVADKLAMPSLPGLWCAGVFASVALFVAWRTRLWLGAVLFLPLFLVAAWASWGLHSEPFGTDLQHELGHGYTVSADLMVLFALAASGIGGSLRFSKSPPSRV